MTRQRLHRLLRLPAAAVLAMGLTGSALVVTSAGAVTTYPTTAPMILNNVSPDDLLANYRGICNGSFQLVIRGVSSATNALRYLDAAQHCGLKAILYLAPAVSGGTVYPSRVAPIVNAVKSHPALYGYLTVKEPSWVGISASEIRSLYKAVKAADTTHPVAALFGDIPHFGDTRNPYLTAMADIVIVDWYPVETASGGCSSSGTSYISYGPKWYSTKVYPKVHTVTPKVPIWVMVQTHKNLAPSWHANPCGVAVAGTIEDAWERALESDPVSAFGCVALLNRQVREAFVYAHAQGIAFHTWDNINYNIDERRDGTMVSWMKTLSGQVHAGTFQ